MASVIPEILAVADGMAYRLASRGITRESQEGAMVIGMMVGETRRLFARVSDELAENLADLMHAALIQRFTDYQTDAPWHHWPVQCHGQRLALLLGGIEDEEERDEEVGRYCGDIEGEMIRAGFSAEVASNWTEEIAGEAGSAEWEIRHAGGHGPGRA